MCSLVTSWSVLYQRLSLSVQDMGNGVTVEELMRTVEDLSRSCH